MQQLRQWQKTIYRKIILEWSNWKSKDYFRNENRYVAEPWEKEFRRRLFRTQISWNQFFHLHWRAKYFCNFIVIDHLMSSHSIFRHRLQSRSSFYNRFFVSNTKDRCSHRTFHNLSAHYNGYQCRTEVWRRHRQTGDFTRRQIRPILKVFQYANAEKSKRYPDGWCHEAYLNVIARHTIIDKTATRNPPENDWR